VFINEEYVHGWPNRQNTPGTADEAFSSLSRELWEILNQEIEILRGFHALLDVKSRRYEASFIFIFIRRNSVCRKDVNFEVLTERVFKPFVFSACV
jgi:hypothetical protein